jgi:hypothetical protein
VNQDDLYREAADSYGASLQRLARAYEADTELRRDLLQDIHLQLWRSFRAFRRALFAQNLGVPRRAQCSHRACGSATAA